MTKEQENNLNVFCDYILELIEKYGECNNTDEERAD